MSVNPATAAGGGGDDLTAAAERMAEPVAALAELWSRGAAVASPRLSAHQMRALTIVGRGGRTNLTGLAEAAGLGMSNASRLCDRLEAAGLLERAVSADNRREVELMLTSHGRRLLDDVDAQRRRDLLVVLRGMPPDRVIALTEGLDAFHRSNPDARGRRKGGS